VVQARVGLEPDPSARHQRRRDHRCGPDRPDGWV